MDIEPRTKNQGTYTEIWCVIKRLTFEKKIQRCEKIIKINIRETSS
jgi:hypothetical protein